LHPLKKAPPLHGGAHPLEALITLSLKVNSTEKPVIQQFVSLIHVPS
jgi:hypothetical protein